MMMQSYHCIFISFLPKIIFERVVKSLSPDPDHLGSDYVSVTHNMCDFGHVT